MANEIIKLENIDKSFNGVRILDQVNFKLFPGEVHALVGGNGAGKSTLMKIMTGVYTKDAGNIYWQDKKVSFHSPKDAEKAGISMIYQEFSLAPTLTVAENIFLNNEYKKNGLIDKKKCLAETRRIFNELSVDIDPNAVMASLPASKWQMTEIAKALARNAKVLVMDEPTSCLTETEVANLFEVIRGLKQKGIGIVYISHRMKEIYQICDFISVLSDGKNVLNDKAANITMDQLIHAITGKEIDRFEWKPRTTPIGEEVVLRATDIRTNNNVNGISLELHKGEVLGLAGLGGSGTVETLRALFGIDPIVSGKLEINGKKVKFKNPKQAMDAMIALLPEDRREEGVIVNHSIKDNIILAPIEKLSSQTGYINDRKASDLVDSWVDRLQVKTDSIKKLVRLLSGGNQQKVVFAKMLSNEPDIVLMAEPTKGIDIGSKAEIMDIIRGLSNENKSVIMVSSELAEMLAICDKILIIHQGEVINTLLREEIKSEEELQHAIQNF